MFGRDDLTFVVDQIAVNGTYLELDSVALLMPFYILYEFLCLFVTFLLYVHGKHLRSCRDGQFFNHTLSGQAYRCRLVH